MATILVHCLAASGLSTTYGRQLPLVVRQSDMPLMQYTSLHRTDGITCDHSVQQYNSNVTITYGSYTDHLPENISDH